MEVQEDLTATGHDSGINKSPANISETPADNVVAGNASQQEVNQAAFSHNASAQSASPSGNVEFPASGDTHEATRDVAISNIHSIDTAEPETEHSRLDAPSACTANITDPSELPSTYQSPPDQNPPDGVTSQQNVSTGVNQNDMPLNPTAQAQLYMAAAAPPVTLPGVTTQIAPAMQPDTDSSDEAYAESTTTSYVTSIKSEISKGVLENERLYPSYGQHDYGMPIDDDELDRMDLQHRKYELVIGDKHFLAPIGPTPQRILDLGTGTGIWALDVADMYPSAQVIGVDIAPIQPKWVASNCQFEIDDVEETWTFKENSFDFIHFRDPLYVIRNWPRLMEQCYTHTKPGGWCELACIYPVPMCDDGTMPPDSGFKVICDKFIEASYLFGTPADSPLYFAEYLRSAGFVDVAEHIFKVPSSPWPKDKRLKQIGALEMTNVVEGATAFGLRAFEKVFGWTKDQTELAMVNFRRDVKNRHYHQYCQ